MFKDGVFFIGLFLVTECFEELKKYLVLLGTLYNPISILFTLYSLLRWGVLGTAQPQLPHCEVIPNTYLLALNQ